MYLTISQNTTELEIHKVEHQRNKEKLLFVTVGIPVMFLVSSTSRLRDLHANASIELEIMTRLRCCHVSTEMQVPPLVSDGTHF